MCSVFDNFFFVHTHNIILAAKNVSFFFQKLQFFTGVI
ncbi:hypothetical protein CHISP_0471 [Chitinispirillum alkaliphilum]|nr:hypothetical protein CHISP_0471 [Chitinispirillum alkaliphilum]